MARRIMHIDLDAFFISVEQVFGPELSKDGYKLQTPGLSRGKQIALNYTLTLQVP